MANDFKNVQSAIDDLLKIKSSVRRKRKNEQNKKKELFTLAINNIETNTDQNDEPLITAHIILIDLTGSTIDAASFVSAAKEQSIWVSALGPRLVRLITHLDINDADVDRASEVLASLLQKAFVTK